MAPLVCARGVDHIVLRVRDPVATARWYEATLGLAPVRLQEYQEGKVPFPSARVTPTFLIDFFKHKDEPGGGGSGGGAAAAAAEAPAAPLPDAGSDTRRQTGFDHFCLVVDGADIEAVRQQLAAAGIAAEQQFDGVVVGRFGAQGDARSIYIRDPDNNVVELRSYSEGEAEQAASGAGQAGAGGSPADAPLVTESKCAQGSGI